MSHDVQAAVIDQLGGQFEVRDLSLTDPGPAEVLVKVESGRRRLGGHFKGFRPQRNWASPRVAQTSGIPTGLVFIVESRPLASEVSF